MTDRNDGFRVAAVQAAPAWGDPEASLAKAARLIAQAGGRGAQLVAFGEAWLPGYPLHALAPSSAEGWWDVASDYLARGVEVPGAETQTLCDAARDAGVDVVIGVCERDPGTRGTLYSTLLFIGAEGEILARHRKLRPSPHERAVWGDGDAVDMRVHDRGYAMISGLSGCEHQMALPTYALAEQGCELHVAAWPGFVASDPRRAGPWPSQELLSRAFAAQAGCYVVCVGGVYPPSAAPEAIAAHVGEGFTGGSMVVDPRGGIVTGPASGETILYVDCNRAAIRSARVAFDCAGHSARKDQLKLWTPLIEAHEAAMDDPQQDDPSGAGPRQGWSANQPPPRT